MTYFCRGCGSEEDHLDHDRQRLVQMYEEKIEELIKQHDADLSDQKHGSNDKIEALLHKLAECNTRYCDLVPDYEQVSSHSFFDNFPKFKFFMHDCDY